MTTETGTSSRRSGAGLSTDGDLAYLRRSESRVEDGPSPGPSPCPTPSSGPSLGPNPTPNSTPTSNPSPSQSPSLTQQESQKELRDQKRRDLLESRKDMLASINAYSVVLVLLASVTFAGFLQPPGGLKQDANGANGTLQKTGFHMNNFIVPLSISFYLAVAGILVCMSCTIFVLRLPQKGYRSNPDKDTSLEEEIQILHASLKWAGVQEVMINICFIFSLFCCTQAFVYAGLIITDREQQEYFRRILSLFGTVNAILFITYSISLILSGFIRAPVHVHLQWSIEKRIESLKKWLKKRSTKRVGTGS